VNGAGSLLTLTGTGEHFVGGSAGSGSIVLQNSTSAAAISGSLGIGDAAVASGGSVAITGNSTMTLAGDLKLATQNLVGSSGTLSISGVTTASHSLDPAHVIVGSFNNGAALMTVAGSTSATLNHRHGRPGNSNDRLAQRWRRSSRGRPQCDGDIYVSGGGAGTGLTVASGSTSLTLPERTCSSNPAVK